MRTLVLIVAATLLLAACGGRTAKQPPAGPTPAAGPAPAAEAPAATPAPTGEARPASPAGEQEVKITMTEFKFEPQTVEVKAGKVDFELVNAGTVEHSFVILGTDKRLDSVSPGQSGELEVELRPGTYQVECDIPGHKEAGMVMTIVVK
ncbi:MAG: cupredoxin domain-containing protein [Armatimonadota bacterium]|nr:cupredoxin domain-containing protein [Armatimonadota bacterium]